MPDTSQRDRHGDHQLIHQLHQPRCQPFAALPVSCRLDRLADAELQAGHHHRAELLARRADELRESAR